jgi:hypothetical protein
MSLVRSSRDAVSTSVSPAACTAPYRPRLTGARVVLGPLGLGDPPVRCWSWRCSGCALLKSRDAQRLATLGIAQAVGDGSSLVLLTVTEPSLPRSFKASSKALTLLMKRLQARAGGGLRWMAVAEWQRRGAVHWHVVIAGLVYTTLVRSKGGRVLPGHSGDAAGHRVRKEADLRPLVERYGFGPMFEVHAVGVRPEDSAAEVASYLAKYLTKSEDMARLPKGAQPVRSSRGRNQWAPGYTLTSLRDERRETARERAAAGEAA